LKRELVLDAAAPIDRRVEAALAMAGDAAGARMLIGLAAQSKVAYQLREAVGSVIFGNADSTVRAVAAGYFPRPGGQQRTEVMDVIRLEGNATRGQARFYGSCASCHRIGRAGADIGPDLSDVRKKFDAAGLIEAIVNPNAAIAFGYGVELFVRRGSEPVIGFLQVDGPMLSVRDSSGRTVTFEREAMTARVPLKPSLMPDPLASGLTDQDVADIAAFLMNMPK
jgi:putative heme-binding domain-containing protein